MMDEWLFPNVVDNGRPYNMAEIWQLPMNGGGVVADSGSGLRRTNFGFNNSSHFGREYPGTSEKAGSDHPVSSEQTGNKHGAATRKRCDSEESNKILSTSNGGNTANNSNGKRFKASSCNNHNNSDNGEAEPSSGKHVEQNTKPPLEPSKGYIHVRARRGQATDSHSLAERARREKISERMKILQDLVPGCNKVTGKALVLDEIINYVQSLHRQVEFLSMKLEAVNASINPGVQDSF